MNIHPKRQGLVVVGGGPAGLAPLFAFASAGRLQELLELGVTVLERGDVLGAGALGGYAIHSDSSAEALLDIVFRSNEPILSALRSHPVAQALAQFAKDSAPLKLVGLFLQLAGTALCDAIAASRRGCVVKGATAMALRQEPNGTWRTRYTDASGQFREVVSTNVVLATGAHQPTERLYSEVVAGHALLPRYGDKLMQSGQVLAEGGPERVAHFLRGRAKPKVAIVGGSTSSAATALALLTRLPEITFPERGVTLLHRKPLRIFYETAQQALAEGYTEFTADDVCALTGRVFRLSGFRLDSRELIMKARGLAGRPAEPRVQLLQLTAEHQLRAQAALEEADLIVAALGYRPRLLRLFDTEGNEIETLRPDATRWAVVDQSCRLLTRTGDTLPGLFAIGLAVGPAASRQFGGEADFKGQVNSLWLWQHTLGKIIAEQAVQRVQERKTRAVLAASRRYRMPYCATDVLEEQGSSNRHMGAR